MRYNLRHLRVFLAVVETGSASKAADVCLVSQPAVTQAVAKVEKILGYPLFQRHHGFFLTEFGRSFTVRVRRSLEYLDPALVDLSPRLKITASSAQLEALVAVCELQNYTLAARKLGISQPTVHRAVNQLEEEAGRPLFERTSFGMVATKPVQHLARAIRLAFLELRQAEAELAESCGKEAGGIVVGGMPLSRSSILPSAIVAFRNERPRLPIRIVEGAYPELLAGLRRGEIDFLVGALRSPLPIDDVEQETLFHDMVEIVASRSHPLAGKDKINLSELAIYPWVVARSGTPIRSYFDALFLENPTRPSSLIESSSLILMRELLDLSHHLGFISGSQIKPEVARGAMISLPFDLSHTSRPIGFTTRKGWLPTIAQSQLMQDIRAEVSLSDPTRD